MSKAYGIGPGKVITWAELAVQDQSPVKLNVVENQSFCKLEARQMKLSPRKVDKEDDIAFECNVEGCSLSFATLDELHDHISFGEHDKDVLRAQECLYDKLHREWALKFSVLSAESEKQTSQERQ